MVNIDQLVDQKLEGRPEATKTKKTRTKRFLRLVGAGGSSIGLIKGLVIFGVTAALISTIIGSFIVSQQMDIPLEGREAYDLFVDGVAVGADDFVMNPDVFSDDKLTWGETETFTHTFMSPEFNGNFDIWWNQDWQTWRTTPSAEFYGYNFTTTDINDEPITWITVMNGTTVTVNFVHYLNNHFAATDNPLPFDFAMHVVEYVPAPVAHDDTISCAYGGNTVAHVLANDEGTGLVITAVNDVPTGITVTIINGGQDLNIYSYGMPGSYPFTYVVDSGEPLHKTDVGAVNANIV